MLKQTSKQFWTRLVMPVGLLALVVICTGATIYALIAKTWEDKRLALKVELTTNNNLKILDVIHSMTSERVHGGMRLLMDKGKAIGEPSVENTSNVDGQIVPNLKFGSRSQSGHYGLVDSVTRAIGGTQTLFARVGDDYVRVSTNVIRDNERAIGTRLERDSKAYEAIRQGAAYYGVVYILGVPYLAGYEPMIGKNGAVVGIWYVGYRIDMQLLKELAEQTVLPEGGIIAALDSFGNPHVYSPNITSDRVRALTAGEEPGWKVIRKKFDPWNFELIAAYPENAPGIFVLYRALILIVIFTSGFAVVFFAAAHLLRKWIWTPLGEQPLEIVRHLKLIVQGDEVNFDIPLKPGDNDSALATLYALHTKMRQVLTPIRQNSLDIAGQLRDVDAAAKKLLDERNDEALINLQAQLRVLRRSTGMLDQAAEQIPRSWTQRDLGSYTYRGEQSSTLI